jgi:apolipoprotein N-acyltransferase
MMEWVFGHHGSIAFPWLGLGTSLTGFPGLVQWADVAGARGVTFWLAASSALVAIVLLSPARHWRSALAVIGSVVVALGYGVLRARSLETHGVGRVLLVQSNEKLAVERDTTEWTEAVAGLIDETERAVAAARPGLVLWPEASLPADSAEHLELAQDLGRRVGVPMVIGALERIPGGASSGRLSNSAMLIDAAGRVSGPVYRKRHLVPVAERGAIEPGKDGVIMRLPAGVAAGVVICYEVAFEGLARAYRRGQADVLLNLSNDAWAGRTNARAQHVAHLVMRAIETRMGVARVANTGPSLVVDPLGRVTAHAPSDTSMSMIAELTTAGVTSWYVRMGDWVALAAGAVVLGLTGMLGSSSRPGRLGVRDGWQPRDPAHR